MNDNFSLDQHAEDFYENGFEPNEVSLNKMNDDEIAAHNMQFRFGGYYSQYQGQKSVGCVYFWLKVFAGIQYAESCCVQGDKRITGNPYSSEKIADSFEWIEDAPNEFRPRFEFADGFGFAAKEQEIYEKYLLNK